ncbi:MAG: hypothetical protein HFK02_03755 [Clostridia bacterium]|jgi:cell division protein FtsB|nr:hypothetical protein [Clostridia bacterium]
MTQEKRNRIISAVTVNAVILIFILAAVAIYQIVDMTVISRRYKNLKAQYTEYTEKTDNINATLDYYKSAEGLLDKAYEFGWVFQK